MTFLIFFANIKKSMKKSLIFLAILIVLVGFFFLFENLNHQKGEEKEIKKTMTLTPAEKRKKAALIIAFEGFKDEEYLKTKEKLEEAGVEVETFSNLTGTAKGADGTEVEIALTLKDLNIDDYDAIVFIGGPGALKNLDNDLSYQIAQETASKNKILAAICISPVILAKSGVLNGKKATVWSSPLDQSPIETLQKNGAIYLNQAVVVDGNIITANGPQAASQFGETIAEKLFQ